MIRFFNTHEGSRCLLKCYLIQLKKFNNFTIITNIEVRYTTINKNIPIILNNFLSFFIRDYIIKEGISRKIMHISAKIRDSSSSKLEANTAVRANNKWTFK